MCSALAGWRWQSILGCTAWINNLTSYSSHTYKFFHTETGEDRGERRQRKNQRRKTNYSTTKSILIKPRTGSVPVLADRVPVQTLFAPRFLNTLLALEPVRTRHGFRHMHVDPGPRIPRFHSRTHNALRTCRCQIHSLMHRPLTVSLPGLADILTHKCQPPVHSHLSKSLNRPSKYKDCEPQPRYECIYVSMTLKSYPELQWFKSNKNTNSHESTT